MSDIIGYEVLHGDLVQGPVTLGDYVVSVEDIENGHRVVITKGASSQTIDLTNGLPGSPGTPGSPGAPGRNGTSPTVSVEEIEGGHRVTITDTTGPHAFDVMDGEDSESAVTSVNGETGPVTLTADKIPFDSAATHPNGSVGKEIGGIKDALSELPKSVSMVGTALTPDTDGNVNVPATAESVYGVVKLGEFKGLKIDTAGDLSIRSAYASDVNEKRHGFFPITPNNIDTAIRAGLLSNSKITSADLPSIQATLGFVTLTQEEYDLMASHDANTLYIIVAGDGA